MRYAQLLLLLSYLQGPSSEIDSDAGSVALRDQASAASVAQEMALIKQQLAQLQAMQEDNKKCVLSHVVCMIVAILTTILTAAAPPAAAVAAPAVAVAVCTYGGS